MFEIKFGVCSKNGELLEKNEKWKMGISTPLATKIVHICLESIYDFLGVLADTNWKYTDLICRIGNRFLNKISEFYVQNTTFCGLTLVLKKAFLV